ncbi:flippase [Oceanotoga sp. DSM 15011]|nr:flippase [Oceanotoga sp. DSM 15011]
MIIARGLGVSGQGRFSYLILIFGLIGSYGHFGILSSTSYFQKRSDYDTEDIFNTNIFYSFINSLIIFLVILFLSKNNFIFQNYDNKVIYLGYFFIIFNYIMVILRALYIGEERIHELNKFIFIGPVVNFILVTVLYYFNLLSVNLVFISKILVFLIPCLFLYKNLNIKFKPKINLRILKSEFKYGIILYFSALFVFLNYRADQFMIKNFLGVEELGIYSIGVQLAELLFLVPNSITTALTGRLYNMDLNDTDNQKKITTQTSKYTFYVSLFLSIIGIMMTPLIPIVYGKEYERASFVVVLLFIGIIFASIAKVSYSYFITKGNPKVHLIITGITLVINIILNYFLIPLLGINGAALASTISYFVYGFVYLLVFKLKEKICFKEFFYINKNDIKYIINIFKKKFQK